MESPSSACTPARGALRAEVPGVLAMAAAFAAGIAVTWHRLGSLFIDCGRELEVPRRILEGERLYRDLRYYWGPLAPHVNAALYAAFGVSLETARWAGIATGALAAAGLYLLARELLGRLPATLVAIAFMHLGVFACLLDVPIFNFVLPFNYSATYGITAAIWSVHLLLVHARTGRTLALAGSALLLLLTWLAKAEVAFAATAAHATFAGASLARISWRHAVAYGAAAALAAATYGLFLARTGAALWRDNLAALGNEASAHYVSVTMGLWDGAGIAGGIAVSLGVLGGVVAAAWLLSRGGDRPGGTPGRVRIAGAAAVAFLAGAAVVPFRTGLRALPIVMVAAIAALLHARLRRGEGILEGRWREHLTVWVFALACLARIPLRAGPEHYGFYLFGPALVCVAILYFDHLPRIAGSEGRARLVRAAGAGLMLGLTAGALSVTVPIVAATTVPGTGPRGHMLFPEEVPEPFVIEFLASLRGVRSAVAVPQGAGVLFASGLPSGADGMTSYMPMEIPDDAADARLVARWAQDPPDLVLYWAQEMSPDFGYLGFGVDYARRSRRWLFDNYVPLTDPSAKVVVLVRADARHPVSSAP